MSDMILFGTRRWTADPGCVGFEDQYDQAVEIICSYIADAIRISNSAHSPKYEMYFQVAPMSLLGDLNGAVGLLRRTPVNFHRRSFAGLIQQLPREWRSNEAIALWLEMIWNETLDQQLSRVWRNPEHFPRSPSFDQELGNRAMAFSLPAMVWSGNLTAAVVQEALDQLETDFEESKWDWTFAMHLAHRHTLEKAEPFGRKEIKKLKREFRMNEFSAALHALYEDHVEDVNLRVAHVLKYASFMGWELRPPNLRVSRG